MASNRETSGIKVFESAVFEQLEDFINQFLSGSGDADDPAKVLVYQPSFFVSGGTFYVMLYYRTV